MLFGFGIGVGVVDIVSCKWWWSMGEGDMGYVFFVVEEGELKMVVLLVMMKISSSFSWPFL